MTTSAKQSTTAAVASFIGTTVEWYDFYIYGLAAALVFGPLFFPAGTSAYIATLAAFATFAVGFFARPIGGLIFGHLGDRFGRKRILVVTLMMMGLATVGIGLLPTYAQAGVWAPIGLTLLRIVQGIAVGGEWGGAVLLAAEHAPKKRKTFFASFAQLGSPAGLILALLAFREIGLLDQASFLAWGWRIPFLISSILLVIGLFIRLNVSESPEFEDIRRSNRQSAAPIREVFGSWLVPILLAVGANTIGIAAAYLFNTFMIAYTTQYLQIPRVTILDALFLVAIGQFIIQPIAARISESFSNEKRFVQVCLIWAILFPYPLFLLIDTRNFWAIVAGLVLNLLGGAGFYAVVAGYLAAVFPTRVRYTAISTAYQFCGAIAGGLTPLVGTFLAENFKGQWWPLAVFASLLAGISLVCATLIWKYRPAGEDDKAPVTSAVSDIP
jgi:MFS family permease